MAFTQPVGRHASALKYDILTALGTYALSRSKHDQRLVLRFITLLTARYNWARNELAVGQREIARLWSVDERTVKREMAKLRALGWLVVKRQGARGHVTEYRLDRDRMLSDTRGDWDKVGPDFDLRMQAGQAPAETANVVPLNATARIAAPDVTEGSEWALARALLHSQDTASYGTWIAALDRVDRAGGRVILKAPSRFHASYVEAHLGARIFDALRAVDDSVAQVSIIA